MKTLPEICRHWRTDKFQHGYTPVYEKYFGKYRDKEINFLEIGVYKGSSIFAWLEYFQKAQIFALDIYNKSHLFNHPRVHFFQMDASDENSINNLMVEIERKTKKRKIDLLVDDGSHFQYDQMTSLGKIFPHISNGGIYAIEDICYERNLRKGSQWWGYSKEAHHSVAGECHLGSHIRPDEEWLAGDEINYDNCSDATLTRFVKTNLFSSKYLTEEQNEHITQNTDNVSLYDDQVLASSSKLCIINKK
jgi:hypothetical protein